MILTQLEEFVEKFQHFGSILRADMLSGCREQEADKIWKRRVRGWVQGQRLGGKLSEGADLLFQCRISPGQLYQQAFQAGFP